MKTHLTLQLSFLSLFLSFGKRFAESIPHCFQYDGVLNDDHTPYLVDLVNQGSVIIPDFDSVVPDQFIDPDIPYHRYVKGSEWARMNING